MEPRRFAVIGHPIGHSLSPIMHEASFGSLGLSHTYEKIDVSPAKLSSFIEKAKGIYSGINVTIPHKQAVIPLLDELSREADVIGAVNTIKFGRKNVGYNTDGIGFVKSLADEGVKVKGERFFVMGAGGAGRAIVFQLSLEGAKVALASEFTADSERLAGDVKEKLGKKIEVLECGDSVIKSALECADVFVNATPVGMKPNTNASVVDTNLITKKLVVVDVVYNPKETLLLGEAKKRGAKTVSGVGMLVQQGAESERIWLGIEPDVGEMKKAVLRNLL